MAIFLFFTGPPPLGIINGVGVIVVPAGIKKSPKEFITVPEVRILSEKGRINPGV